MGVIIKYKVDSKGKNSQGVRLDNIKGPDL
jgi:hypothetical protein